MLNVIAARAVLYGRAINPLGTKTFAWGMDNDAVLGIGTGTGVKKVAPLPCSAYQDVKEEMYMQDLYKCQQRQHQQLSQETTNTKTNQDGGQHHLCTKVFSQTTFTLPDKKANWSQP